MSTKEIAQKLVEYCRKGDFETPMKELYSQDAVSIEMPGGDWPEKCTGMDEIQQKGEKFYSMTEEIHGVEVTDPIIAENFFSLGMTMDITYKGAPRMKNAELCVYEVKDGKIISEQFFYPLPPSA